MSCLPEGHVYSYSQLSSVYECPYSYYEERIDLEPDGSPKELQSNFFAEHGSLVHKIIEKWAKGEITREQMPEEYALLYPAYVVTPPPGYMTAYRQKAFDSGYEYFMNFDGFPDFEIISAEDEFVIDLPLLDGTTRPFKGVIDLICKDKATGELIIMDHKSKSMKEFKKCRDAMYRQQYLYSAYVKQKFGHFPDRLMFNLFKESYLDDIRFDEDEYDNILRWAADCIHEIEERDIFTWLEMKPEPDFFCNEICSVRKYCPNGTLRPQPKRKKVKE